MTRKILLFMLLNTLFVLKSEPARAFLLEVKAGPPGAGTGGTNPLSIPPGVTDLEFTYISNSTFQYTLSLVPGLIAGKRFYHGHYFGTLGGGLLFTANGAGFGPYVGMGYRTKRNKDFHFVAEFKQAIGFLEHYIAPYAMRIGVAYGF